MDTGFMRSLLEEIKGGIETSGEWKYIVAAFLITIFATAIFVLMLPETPLEFW